MTIALNDYPLNDPQDAADEFRPQCALCGEYLRYPGARCPIECDLDLA